ncbi:outer membrane protein [Legionella busanensis]|uniref:Outer membrane protein n=1 Tax=Legionella busanensis TaxID=190655 RepID=A0A378JFB6_9GAMM|nr:Lpg1974 family pore-forming outer membrane protein [Legionella busanensis]STX49946.1 outer membrane protein [Legionella busanensis]
MKKFFLPLLALSGNVAFGGAMGPVCTPGQVTVPCEATGFDVGVHALYLRPALNGNTYYDNYLGYNTNGKFLEKNDDWLWGFKLEVSYHFGTGSDLNINWYHLNDHITTRGNTYISLVSGSNLAFAYDDNTHKWDAVNAEFGQHTNFGIFKDVRFHAGLQYARLKTKEYGPVNIISTETGSLTPSYNDETMKFEGLGPRVGMDLMYHFNEVFSVFGNIASSLLIGDASSLDVSANINPPLNSSTTTIVPELDTKLGLAYTYNLPISKIIVDAGYMATNYFQALSLPSNVIPSSSYGFHGPFFGLKYVSMI